MRNVNNKKCINNICKKSMAANIRRNVILGIAIVLSTMMLTTLFTVGSSIVKSIQESTMLQVGTTQHGGFKFMTQEEYDVLAQDTVIRDLSYNIILGNPINEELREDYTELRYITEANARTSYSYPEVGRLPESRYEVATCTQVLDDFGVPYEIGQTLHLTIAVGEKLIEDDFTLCGYWEKPAVAMANQIYLSEEFQKEFAPTWQSEEDRMRAIDNHTYAGAINPDFNFPTTVGLDTQMDELEARCGFGNEMQGGVNWAYMTSSVDPTSVIMVVFILALIIGSGYLIIYNIFFIAVSSDIRYYGLLKTVGTTDKQLKRIILRQAYILALIAIPVGMIIGYLLSIVALPIIAGSMLDVTCKITPSISIFVLSALFAWLTIRISCIKPCKVVKKVSPMEAVRYSEYTGSNLSAEKKIRKVTPFSMAWENLKRNRKKSIVVVLSLALSVIMINVTVSITGSLDEEKYVKEYAATDFIICDGGMLNRGIADTEFDGVSQDAIEELSQIPGITDIGSTYMTETFQLVEGDAYDRLVNLYESHLDWYGIYVELESSIYDEHVIPSHIYGVDEFVYENMELDEGSFDWEKFTSGKYVIASSPVRSSSGDDAEYAFYKIGDKVNITFSDGTTDEYEVIAIGDLQFSMGPEHTHGLDVYFTLPAEEYLKHAQTNGAMKLFFNVDDEHIADAEEIVDNYCSEIRPELGYESRQLYIDDFREMIGMFLLVGGALSFILALIGVLNFINLTYTSIHERKKELEVLRAIGMTGKQQTKMLIDEGIIHIMLTFAFVLTIGLVLNYFIVNTLAGGMLMFSYKFIIWPIIACIPVFVAISAIVPVMVKKN